ncbi:unannotated protein [freshwater metagenome]|uniref:Unannotated protein n=1 Tax=freshwater metagenome TaxID=449393 RepID=A0A6J6NVL2_9ZZZZ
MRQAELGADGANPILEKCAKWLAKLELQTVGQAADVVMALDASGCAAARLDHIRIKGALHQKLDWSVVGSGLGNQGRLGLFEGANELATDDLALGLWVGNTLERV